MKLNRREFVASTSAALVAGENASAASGQPVPANERLRGGFIGVGGMGQSNLRDFLRMDDVEVVAICDVWQGNLNRALKMAERQKTGKAKPYSDFRKLLERKDIDFVVVSTPDHWHAIPAIMACESGKDVYVEKPLSHTIYEGRKMVEAARANQRVVQAGTQQRSGEHYQEAVKLIQNGGLGKISHVKAYNHGNESPFGMGSPPDTKPPKGLDWDFWLGPAPVAPFNPNRFLGTFRWFWDYSGGKLTDWGTHHIDIIHWAMETNAPKSVDMMGGKYVLTDNRETPDTVEAVFDYGHFLLTYSNRNCNSRDPVRWGYGIEFYGSEGSMFLDRDGYEVFPEVQSRGESPPREFTLEQRESDRPSWQRSRRQLKGRTQYLTGEGSEQHITHVRNFLDCVKSREEPASDVEIAHRSTSAPHLANISYKVGRRINWDAENEQVIGDAEANRLVTKEYRAPWKI
jgi:predicted dehydrogenase